MSLFGLALIALTTLFPILQLAALPNVTDKIALFSQYLGMAALILMAWGQIMATRLRGIETIFGGLDRVYVLHKWAGIIAMLAILVHDTIDADMDGLGAESALNDLAETLGEISLYGLLILVVISVATFIPYHLWKWTHKAMGALFAAGTFQFFFILKPFAMTDPAGFYTGAFCIAGLIAYAWTVLPETMRPSHGYRITALEQTGDATAITLAPMGRGLRHKAGQFGVFRFTGANMGEAHPFSFSDAPRPDRGLRVTIKPMGDFTTKLLPALQIGQELRLQGPYGRFERKGKKPEIWIAAGIGITPILAWAETLEADSAPVDLFYCIRSRALAPHLDRIEELAASKPNLTLHLIVSSEGKRLTPEVIFQTIGARLSEAKLGFCGPASLREALKTGLRRYGVTARNFHYEEFEFRTGIGLEQLARWVLARAAAKARNLGQRQSS